MNISEIEENARPFNSPQPEKKVTNERSASSLRDSAAYQFSFNPDNEEFYVEKNGQRIKAIKIKTIKGKDGKDGDTWTPHFTPDGKLYFRSDQGNQTSPLNIKGADGKDLYDIWIEENGVSDPSKPDFFSFFKAKDGKDGKSAFEIWKESHKKEGKEYTEEDFYNYIASRVNTQSGTTYIPEITPDGKLFFRNSKTGETTTPFDIKGKNYIPRFEGTQLYFIDEEGIPQTPKVDLKGQPGRSLRPAWDADGLFFEDENGNRTESHNLKGQEGLSAFEVWKAIHSEAGKTITEEDFFNDIASRVSTQEGATYIPEFTPDGNLYFKNTRTGEMTEPHSVKGTDGKQYFPRFDGYYIYFVDENDIPQTPKYDTRGKDGRTFRPVWNGTSLYFETDEGDKTEEKDLHGKDAFELWKERHHKPDATYEEYEEFFKGANVTSQYSYENIKDSKVPIQKINRNLITDSDLTDGLGAEEYYIYRQERIEAIREKGRAMRGNWFQEIFWWCAGADTSVLRTCPVDHSKYVGIGTVIFFTALMAFFSCFIAMEVVFKEFDNDTTFPIGAVASIPLIMISLVVFFHYGINRRLSKETKDENGKEKTFYFTKIKINWANILIALLLFIFACSLPFQEKMPILGGLPTMSKASGIAAIIATFWSAMIFFLDRFITNTMYSDGKTTVSWLELRSALPRIIISIFLGIVISAPLELKIFDAEVAEYLANQKGENISNMVKNSTAYIERHDEYKKAKELVDSLQQNYNRVLGNRNDTAYFETDKTQILTETKATNSETTDKRTGNVTRTSGGQQLSYGKKRNDVLYKNAVAHAKNLWKDAENELEGKKAKMLQQDSLQMEQAKTDSSNDVEGLFRRLAALHSVAMDRYSSWDVGPERKWGVGIASFLTLLLFTLRTWWGKAEENANGKTVYKWWNLTYIIPLSVFVAVISALNIDTLFHYIPSFFCTAIGLIMLLFIIIDVSPVFYKMMLADGRYDKILHQDKLLEQDLIRLQVAKTLHKVNESELSSLSPFIFGKTFNKVSDMLKAKRTKEKAFDLYEPSGTLGNEIKQANEKLFKDVLNMKYRIAWGAYSAWYRNMYDVMLGKKDDEEGAKYDPHHANEQTTT